MRPIDRWITVFVVLFCLDRLLKLAAVVHFFRRRRPAAPPFWPSVTLLQPITRGAHGLERRSSIPPPKPVRWRMGAIRHHKDLGARHLTGLGSPMALNT